MFDILFKDWLQICEALGDKDIHETENRFGSFFEQYIQPLAKALINHAKKNRNFLNEIQKAQIQKVLSETLNPAIIAMNAGGSSVAMYTPFVSKDYASAVYGYEPKAFGKKRPTGWLNNTWNRFIKDGEKFVFKNYKTFQDYLKYIRSNTKASYEINSFDTLLYWMVLRLKIALWSATRSEKSKTANISLDGDSAGSNVEDKSSTNIPDMPLKIQDCFTKYFKTKAASLEPKVKAYLANMDSPAFFNEPKSASGYDAARIYLWYYLTCKHLSENADALYPTVKKLYEYLGEISSARSGKEQSMLIRSFLHTFDAQKSAPVRQHIVSVLKSGDDNSRLGLGSIAVSIFRNFVRCSDAPDPAEAIVASMPNLAGIKSYINGIKDQVTCRSKTEKLDIHGDRPNKDSGEMEKVDFLVKHFFMLTYPTHQFAEIQREILANELYKELSACMMLPQEDEEE